MRRSGNALGAGAGLPPTAGLGTPGGRRVLWGGRPPEGDNFTDPQSFLRSLVLNARVQRRDFGAVSFGALAIAQQVCVAVLLGAAPAHLTSGRASWRHVCAATGGGLLVGALAGLFAAPPRPSPRELLRGLRQSGLLACGVYFLAPLLQSLSLTTSSDTVVASSAGLLLAHLFLHDYNFANSITERDSGAAALAAAVFAAVLLASRLEDEFQAFAYILAAMELLVLSPFVRRRVRLGAPALHIGLTVLMVVVCALLIWPLSVAAALAFLALVGFLVAICPALLVSSEALKLTINGQWDEAIVGGPRREGEVRKLRDTDGGTPLRTFN